MATVDLLAGQVMNQAAVLMNDAARTNYTYAKMVPWLNLALRELEEWFEQHNLSVTQRVTAPVITVLAGQSQIIFNGGGVPTLPSNLIEPLQMWESIQGQTQFFPMTKRDFLPHDLEGVPTNYLVYWVWENQTVKFLPSNSNIDVKIDYMAEIFTPITNENSAINVMNAETFLEYRTAGLMSEFIERNMTSAQSHNAYAELALNRVTSIGSKSKQRIQTRRRPFRAGYKRRGWMT